MTELTLDPIEIDDRGPRHSVGDLQDVIDDIIVEITEAKRVPLGSGVIVDRDHLLELLERLRDELPDEMRAARWMVREREAFMARTNERAREIIDKAKTESRRMVSESHILAEAVEEANILVRRAEGDARRIRLEAEDDLERGLERVDLILGEVRERIAATRDELHQARPKEPAPPI
jgi:hypothetical protein